MAKRYPTTEKKREVHRRDLAKAAEMDLFVEFLPSNMAAGPCPRAARIGSKRFRPEEAPLPPFDDCSHVDQCGCMYRATFTPRGEF